MKVTAITVGLVIVAIATGLCLRSLVGGYAQTRAPMEIKAETVRWVNMLSGPIRVTSPQDKLEYIGLMQVKIQLDKASTAYALLNTQAMPLLDEVVHWEPGDQVYIVAIPGWIESNLVVGEKTTTPTYVIIGHHRPEKPKKQ